MSESIKFFYPIKNDEKYTMKPASFRLPEGTINDNSVKCFLSNPNLIDYIFETMKLKLVEEIVKERIRPCEEKAKKLINAISDFEVDVYEFIVYKYTRKNSDSKAISIGNIEDASRELTNRFCGTMNN